MFRNYDVERDRKAVHRIWREIGWVEKGKEEGIDAYILAGRALVAEVGGEAESLVCTAPGTMRYLDEEIPFSCVTGVTTSHVARKQGLASRLAARAVAEDAQEGALVAALGMFEQGYYNQIGFGTGGYNIHAAFDPAHLQVEVRPRVPCRVTVADWEDAHTARLARRRGHGGCNVLPAVVSRVEMEDDDCFGLGYRDGSTGKLTHYFWCRAKEIDNGPYSIQWIVYRTREEFLELMAVLRSLGDQVRLVKLTEPAGIQLQDLFRQPFKHQQVTASSPYAGRLQASAYWQMRICDLPGCLAQTHLCGEEARFNLRLTDPIAAYLEDHAPWRGVGGDYVVTLGPVSEARRGEEPGLPTLTASVGAFTRLWLGVRPATGLAFTDALSGPPELLERLDRVLLLPAPRPDWDF